MDGQEKTHWILDELELEVELKLILVFEVPFWLVVVRSDKISAEALVFLQPSSS